MAGCSAGTRHATLLTSGYPGLAYPVDVCNVLGALAPGGRGLAQLVRRLADFLVQEMQAGRIA